MVTKGFAFLSVWNFRYKNAGYAISVLALNCEGLTAGARLGSWRLDAYTGELFVQNANGKFLAPQPDAAAVVKKTPPAAAPASPSAPSPPAVQVPAKTPPLQEIEDKLCFNGNSPSLAAAEELLANYGAALAPALAGMLDKAETYVNDPLFTGTFPYNAIWMLAHIGGDPARAAILRYLPQDKHGYYRQALVGLDLRKKYGRDCAVLHSEADFLTAASNKAKVLRRLPPGQPFRILKARIENPKEEGPRGGPATFDAIEIIPSREKGFIERMGTGDSAYF